LVAQVLVRCCSKQGCHKHQEEAFHSKSHLLEHAPVGDDGGGSEDEGGDGLPVDDEDHGAYAAGERRLDPKRHGREDALRGHHRRARLVPLRNRADAAAGHVSG